MGGWARNEAEIREWTYRTYLSLDQTSLTALWEAPALQIQQSKGFASLHEVSEMLYNLITCRPTILSVFMHPNHIHTNQEFCSHTPCQIYLQKWSATKYLSSTSLNRYVGTPVHGRVITVSSFRACMQTSHCISFCTTPQFSLYSIRACLQTVSTASLG